MGIQIIAKIIIIFFGILLQNIKAVPNPQLKPFLESCVIVYNQVHCDDDDEDYESRGEQGCGPIKTDDCDRSLQLYCHNHVCLPNCHPTKEEYDPLAGKCFRKIGADCRSVEDCDSNAVCERKQCRCAKNFTVDPESGKCVRSAEFGEFCNSEIICDLLSDMVCRNNVCECRSPESQFYHTKRKRCYLRVGEDCTNKARSFQFCPDNSDCIREVLKNFSANSEENYAEDTEGEPYLGILDDETKIFKCTCNKGHAPTNDGKSCLGIYGSKCNSLHRCNTERSFKCYNTTNECQCARPKDQVYSAKHKRCTTLIGSLCKEGDDHCGDWAECRPDADKQVSTRTCECVNGFSPALENEVCLKDHGLNCSTNGGDDDPLCNFSIGLECSNYTGTCQCKDVEQYYDVKLKTCSFFEIAQRRIPVTHYDTSDREYMFHLNNANACAKISVFTDFLWITASTLVIRNHFMTFSI